jgi:hypothetical protein
MNDHRSRAVNWQHSLASFLTRKTRLSQQAFGPTLELALDGCLARSLGELFGTKQAAPHFVANCRALEALILALEPSVGLEPTT